MKSASEIFDEQARENIRQAVIEAEKITGGEIVPAVATSSGRYDRAEDIFGFLFSLIGLSVAWIVMCEQVPAGDFSGSAGTQLSLPVALVVLVILFSTGAALASWLPALRLPFITKAEMTAEVELAAAAAFHNFRAHGAKERTGVLIYVSLYEHMVRVIADDAVVEKVDQAAWAEVVGLVTSGMSKGAPADGLAEAIAKCGQILSGPFPRPAGDVDEISNELRIID